MKVHPNISHLTWFNFFTDFKLYAPIAIIYFANVSGSYALGMAVFSVAMISSAIFEIPTGIFSDRIGRRKTVILGASVAVLYSIFYAIGQSFWILVGGAILEGLSRAFYSGNNDALLHDTLSQSNEEHLYGEYLGHVSKMFQAALAVSAIIGSILATFSFPLIMWLSVIPQMLCLFISFKILEPERHARKSGNIYNHLQEAVSNFVRNRKLRLLSLSSILTDGLGESSYQFQAAFYITVIPLWVVGVVKTISNTGSAIGFHYSGKIIRRFGAARMLIISNVYTRFINSLAVLFPTPASPFIMSSSSVFHGVSTVAGKSLMQKEFKSEQRATMGSLDSFAGSIFFGIMAIIMGAIADRITPAIAILSFQILQLPKIWLYWKIYKIK